MTALALAPLDDGRATRLPVRAQPGARRSGLAGLWNGRLKVALRAPPEDGRANAELVELVAQTLGLRRGDVALIAGERARQKDLRVALPPDELRARLAPHLDAGAGSDR
jgi:uncharacterized protein (TIGR00251 family)